MPALDWIFVALLLASLLLGAWRGLVYEVLSVLAWIVAFVLAQWLAPGVAQRLPMSGATEMIRYARASRWCSSPPYSPAAWWPG